MRLCIFTPMSFSSSFLLWFFVVIFRNVNLRFRQLWMCELHRCPTCLYVCTCVSVIKLCIIIVKFLCALWVCIIGSWWLWRMYVRHFALLLSRNTFPTAKRLYCASPFADTSDTGGASSTFPAFCECYKFLRIKEPPSFNIDIF